MLPEVILLETLCIAQVCMLGEQRVHEKREPEKHT